MGIALAREGSLLVEVERGSIERGSCATLAVSREWHISQARQEAIEMARSIGMSPTLSLHVGTAVSELATNLVWHSTSGGAITLCAVKEDGNEGIEVVAEDDGPGIPDVERALQEGFSSKGSLGGGLPGVRRFMEEFDITSVLNQGTRVLARKWKRWP